MDAFPEHFTGENLRNGKGTILGLQEVRAMIWCDLTFSAMKIASVPLHTLTINEIEGLTEDLKHHGLHVLVFYVGENVPWHMMVSARPLHHHNFTIALRDEEGDRDE